MILLCLLFIISLTNATYLYFERNSSEIFISESLQIYTKISLIKALSSPSLSIEYELHGDTNKTFYLNSHTGEFILLNSLDYETIPLYKLTIEARSSSSSISPCFSELIIHIINTNDNPPEINLVIYPSVLYESNIIKYDLNHSSTPFATITIKDLDQSTKNLTLSINDTEHFQLQLIRQMKNIVIYILSTKNNSQLIDQDSYSLSFHSCDDDQPLLCTNQTYRFHFKSNEYLCHLSFNQKNYIIDIKENIPNQTLLMHKITNKFCENIFYSIDETEHFYMDSYTGDLFTRKRFQRIERSVYIIHLFVNMDLKIRIIVRILDQYGNIPFLMHKNLIIPQNKFFHAHLFNATLCRSQSIIENYFQLLTNCTIIPLIKPPKGQYLFHIELFQRRNYRDTFLLELKEEEQQQQRAITSRQSHWIIFIPILLGIFFVLGTIIGAIILIKQKRYKFPQNNPNTSSLSVDEDDGHYNRYNALSTISKLKVHDAHDCSSSPTSTAIYLIGKSSPSLSPARDDEGYSGSSDVSDNHLTIISANQLLEQYRHSKSPLYDTPRRSIDRRHTRNISLV